MNIVPTYSPPNKYLWDSWFIKSGSDYHVFFLQADHTITPEDRHHHSSIGHAVSNDLKHWQTLPKALEIGVDGSWDDLSLWTGSIIKNNDDYYLFYTGRSKSSFWEQKIGLAVSKDLLHWKRYGDRPILQAGRYYDKPISPNSRGVAPAWRDPFVFFDTSSNQWVMLVTARTQSSHVYNGCIGVATSDNLTSWQLQPPLLAPGRYDEMEVPQMIVHKGRYYLFFSTWKEQYEPVWGKKVGKHTGLHCYVSDSLQKPFTPVNHSGVVLDLDDRLYDIQLVEQLSGSDRYRAIGWLNLDERGQFIGQLSASFTITIRDGSVTA